MPTLPSGHTVGITSERARYHAVRQNIRINKDTPHHELYNLVDIIYANDSNNANPWHQGYRFTGFTVSDNQWLKKWKAEDRDSFLEWIKQSSAFHEIEAARNKVIYDTLPDTVMSFDYPDRLYSILQQRIDRMSMSSAGPEQWRSTILNMKHCGVREEEIKWSGVIDFLDEAIASGRDSIRRDELLSRIDFSGIRLELVNELVEEGGEHLVFEETARLIRPEQYTKAGLAIGENEYAVCRYAEPQFDYRIAYIKSQSARSLRSMCWVVFDPSGKALTDAKGEAVCYADAHLAKEAANQHAQNHQEVSRLLRPGNKYEYIGLDGGEDYREWILTLPEYQQSYFTSHFTERNILLHIRTKCRYDNQGTRLLFVEEIQSDWHQQYSLKKRRVSFIEKIPAAPFHKEWPLLALKLILQHAVEEEYDGIAWTPGHIQQIHFQCNADWLLRLYDKVIPQYLTQLSRDWNGSVAKTEIKTKEPWLIPRRSGEFWSVSDGKEKFISRNRFTKEQALAIRSRHSKSIDLEVPVFTIPDGMRNVIKNDALPLFGEMTVDRVKEPLCGKRNFNTCDTETREACLSQQ